jgi:hypothetical protein
MYNILPTQPIRCLGTINWSAGISDEPAGGADGVLTHKATTGSLTRMGQYFSNSLTGTGWSLDFDLGGTATIGGAGVYVRLWGGTSAASPEGVFFNSNGDGDPAAGLVDSNGWTLLVDTGLGITVSGIGTHSYGISQDLGDYDVLVFRVASRSAGNGTTYDNLSLVNPIPEPSIAGILGVGGLVLLRRRR